MVSYSSGQNKPPKNKIDNARQELATNLLKYTSLTIALALTGSMFLISIDKIKLDQAVTLILAISSIFSGLLGSAITYYFSAHK